MHFIRPGKCGCGHEFKEEEEEEDFLTCPKCERKVMFEEILKRVTCPGCGVELNRLFRYPCPKCRKMVGVKDKYCECGEKLNVETGICPYCGKEISADSVNCPKCGKNLYSDEGGGEQGVETWSCGTCGMQLASATSPCPVCDSEY